MSIFRLQENVPDIYPRKSRDFQLLCNAFDAVFNAVKYDIDSITRTADTRLCSDIVLPLLQTKLGFFSKKNFTTDELRTVLQAFRYVVRDKGSRTGIIAAIQVFLKVANASNRSRIIIKDQYTDSEGYTSENAIGNTYIVEVAIEGKQVDTTLLTELLRYVLPAGYQLQYSFYNAITRVTTVHNKDTIQVAFVDIGESRGVRLTTPNGSEERYPYELTFKQVTSVEDGESSYYFERNADGTYTQLIRIPEGWPNGEYYKRVNDPTVYTPVTVTHRIHPEYEPGRYYWQDSGTGTYIVVSSDTPPVNWGTPNIYMEKIEGDYKYVEYTHTYIPEIREPNSYEKYPSTDTYIFFTLDTKSGKYVEVTDIGKGYNIFVATRYNHYERVYLPHNSIHGVSTTLTHPARDASGQLFNYPEREVPSADSLDITQIGGTNND